MRIYGFMVCLLISIAFAHTDALAYRLFEDNFDQQQDWIPDTNTSCGSLETACPYVPTGWTFYRIDEMWPAPQYHPTIQISTENYRGTTGKGYTQWNESNKGNSGDGWGADGILAKLLDNDYQELYVRLYIKFMPGFKWGTAEENMLKLVRILHYDRTGSAFKFFSTGNVNPAFIFDLKKGNWGYRSVSSFRCDPQETVYFCPSNESIDYAFPGNVSFSDAGQAGDGNWHCLEFYVKMNTKSGNTWLSNGEYRFWQDGKLIVEDVDKKLIYDGDSGIGWNFVGIGGNAYNIWTPETNHGEQWYAIDDVVISTDRIGMDCGSTPKKVEGIKTN